MTQKAIAVAHPNIALIKYWGKRDARLNLPAVGSISITLDQLQTRSEVEFVAGLPCDEFILNGRKAGEKETRRVSGFLDLLREKMGDKIFARVNSENNFPTGAGLASSASAFASLALAAGTAGGLNLSPGEYSELARRGSGSAARSIFGGFAEMMHGVEPHGRDAIAVQLHGEDYWDIRVLIAVTSEREKDIGSTAGMNLTAETSPYYAAWVDSQQDDLTAMREALREKDFQKMGELSEFSCLKMHALAMSANPGLLYWNAATTELMHFVREIRKAGLRAYFTIDAGPQVKILTTPEDLPKIRAALTEQPGVKKIIETRLGSDAKIVAKKQ